ncbi:hypothetical protein [Nocardia sp. CA-290969]|uniref:hypothetical protein n=1 Tax=Nocardia sp. CA-290969 TaxID=3239986 RepID=UPI003D93271F
MIDVLLLPGTGYPRGGDGVCEGFAAALDRRRFRPQIVSYPAEFGWDGAPYADSREAGRAALDGAVARSERCVLAGYSQGAVIAGDYARDYELHLQRGIAGGRIAGVALIADGRRPRGAGTPGMPVATGYGIVDQRPIEGHSFPVFWAAAEGDGITSLPAGNPLRTVADLAEWFSIRSLADSAKWVAKGFDRIRRGQMQPWWKLEHHRDWDGAAAYLRGYLWDGRHTTDYTRHGHVQALANAINREVR